MVVPGEERSREYEPSQHSSLPSTAPQIPSSNLDVDRSDEYDTWGLSSVTGEDDTPRRRSAQDSNNAFLGAQRSGPGGYDSFPGHESHSPAVSSIGSHNNPEYPSRSVSEVTRRRESVDHETIQARVVGREETPSTEDSFSATKDIGYNPVAVASRLSQDHADVTPKAEIQGKSYPGFGYGPAGSPETDRFLRAVSPDSDVHGLVTQPMTATQVYSDQKRHSMISAVSNPSSTPIGHNLAPSVSKATNRSVSPAEPQGTQMNGPAVNAPRDANFTGFHSATAKTKEAEALADRQRIGREDSDRLPAYQSPGREGNVHPANRLGDNPQIVPVRSLGDQQQHEERPLADRPWSFVDGGTILNVGQHSQSNSLSGALAKEIALGDLGEHPANLERGRSSKSYSRPFSPEVRPLGAKTSAEINERNQQYGTDARDTTPDPLLKEVEQFRQNPSKPLPVAQEGYRIPGPYGQTYRSPKQPPLGLSQGAPSPTVGPAQKSSPPLTQGRTGNSLDQQRGPSPGVDEQQRGPSPMVTQQRTASPNPVNQNNFIGPAAPGSRNQPTNGAVTPGHQGVSVRDYAEHNMAGLRAKSPLGPKHGMPQSSLPVDRPNSPNDMAREDMYGMPLGNKKEKRNSFMFRRNSKRRDETSPGPFEAMKRKMSSQNSGDGLTRHSVNQRAQSPALGQPQRQNTQQMQYSASVSGPEKKQKKGGVFGGLFKGTGGKKIQRASTLQPMTSPPREMNMTTRPTDFASQPPPQMGQYGHQTFQQHPGQYGHQNLQQHPGQYGHQNLQQQSGHQISQQQQDQPLQSTQAMAGQATHRLTSQQQMDNQHRIDQQHTNQLPIVQQPVQAQTAEGAGYFAAGDQVGHDFRGKPPPVGGYFAPQNAVEPRSPPSHDPASFVGGRRLSEQMMGEKKHNVESDKGFRGPYMSGHMNAPNPYKPKTPTGQLDPRVNDPRRSLSGTQTGSSPGQTPSRSQTMPMDQTTPPDAPRSPQPNLRIDTSGQGKKVKNQGVPRTQTMPLETTNNANIVNANDRPSSRTNYSQNPTRASPYDPTTQQEPRSPYGYGSARGMNKENLSHAIDLHKRSRSPRNGRPASEVIEEGLLNTNDPASRLGTFAEAKSATTPRNPGAFDQEKPWQVGLPGREESEKKRRSRQMIEKGEVNGSTNVNGGPVQQPHQQSQQQVQPQTVADRMIAQGSPRQVASKGSSNAAKNAVPVAELPGSKAPGDDSEDEIVMSSTAYPGQAWMPDMGGYGHWDD